MSAVHETLHGSDKLSEIDLKTYLSKIASAIFQAHSIGTDRVVLKNCVEDLSITINQAYPLGLVVNEMISNSLKYAFPDEREGEIRIRLERLGKQFELTITDNGIGLPEELDWRNTTTLGLKLVRALVQDQLGGRVQMESKNGTKFIVKFDIEE